MQGIQEEVPPATNHRRIMINIVAQFKRAIFVATEGTEDPELHRLAKAIDEQCDGWIDQMDRIINGLPA